MTDFCSTVSNVTCNGHGVCADSVCHCDHYYDPIDNCQTIHFRADDPGLQLLVVTEVLITLFISGSAAYRLVTMVHRDLIGAPRKLCQPNFFSNLSLWLASLVNLGYLILFCYSMIYRTSQLLQFQLALRGFVYFMVIICITTHLITGTDRLTEPGNSNANHFKRGYVIWARELTVSICGSTIMPAIAFLLIPLRAFSVYLNLQVGAIIISAFVVVLLIAAECHRSDEPLKPKNGYLIGLSIGIINIFGIIPAVLITITSLNHSISSNFPIYVQILYLIIVILVNVPVLVPTCCRNRTYGSDAVLIAVGWTIHLVIVLLIPPVNHSQTSHNLIMSSSWLVIAALTLNRLHDTVPTQESSKSIG